MEVILKEDVKGVGRAGQIVKVSEGYARNFLFPGKKAVEATAGAVKQVKMQADQKQEKKHDEEQYLRQLASKLDGVEVTIKKKAADDDKLFGSVSEADIADELKKLGYDLDKKSIVLEGHIKELGAKTIKVRFRHDIESKIKLWIVKDK
jgi:large subunit ribosomal protein L9